MISPHPVVPKPGRRNSRALTAVGILLDALNGACRVDPGCSLAARDATELYRTGVAAVLRVIVLRLAEKCDLLPAHRHASILPVEASVPSSPPHTLRLHARDPFHLWREAMRTYASLGQQHKHGQKSDAESVNAQPEGTDLTAILPIDDSTFRRLLNLLITPTDLAHSAMAADAEIEQIGATYEWLCGFTALRAPGTVVRLKGTGIAPRTVSLADLERALEQSADDLIDFVATQTGRKRGAVARDLGSDVSSRPRRVPCMLGGDALSARLRPFLSLLDLHGTGSCVFTAGELYLASVADRRTNGTHYTSRWMIEPIVRHTLDPLVHVNHVPSAAPGSPKELKSAEEILRLNICDIAMGCGGFLLETCRYLTDRLIDASRRTGSNAVPVPLEGETVSQQSSSLPALSPRQARRLVAMHCVYGVDIDPLAVELARASLWLLVADRVTTPAALGHRLRCGDSLVGTPFSQDANQLLSPSFRPRRPDLRMPQPISTRIDPGELLRLAEPFHWTKEFPEVLVTSSGFDAIIGNPPFGNAIETHTARDPAYMRYAKSQYDQFARGAADHCLLFWARALLYLLRPNGRYGWISPTSLLSDHKPWRQWVDAHARPDVLIRFPVPAFPQARIRTTGICGALGQAQDVQVIDHDLGSASLTVFAPWTDDLHTWHEACERALDPSRSPVPITPRETTCDLRSLPLDLFAGSTTATAYTLQPYISNGPESDGPCLISTGILDRYSCKWGRKSVRYLKRDYAMPRWPASADVPSDVARARDRQEGAKIIIGGLTAVIEAWLDEEGIGAGTVSTWIIRPRSALNDPALFALLAVLNSATFSRIYMRRHGAKAMSGKQTTIQKRALLEMPVPSSLLSSPPALSMREPLDLRGMETQLSLCVRMGRLLQRIPADSPLWSQLDKLAHVAAGLLYGQSLGASLADYDWWCDRTCRHAEPTPLDELVDLAIRAERNVYGAGGIDFARCCKS